MKRFVHKCLAVSMCFVFTAPSALWAAAPSPEGTATVSAPSKASPAPAEQVRLLVDLSKIGPLSILGDFAMKKHPTDSDVTDALTALYPDVTKATPAAWKDAGVVRPQVEGLLSLVRSKKAALRSKGLSAWTYERKLEALLAAFAPPKAVSSDTVEVKENVSASAASDAELTVLKERLKTLEGRLAEAEGRSEKLKAEAEKSQALSDKLQGEVGKAQTRADQAQALAERLQGEASLREKAAEDREKAQVADREAQKEEARLLKKLVDELQDGQKRLQASLAEVDQKAQKKNIDDEELRQSLTILRKDLRDNVQDVSVLKQKVEKLMTPEKTYARPLDKALSSKWVPGAAVLIAVGALVISASKK